MVATKAIYTMIIPPSVKWYENSQRLIILHKNPFLSLYFVKTYLSQGAPFNRKGNFENSQFSRENVTERGC